MSESIYNDLVSTPLPPASGKRKLYSKADGMYTQDDDGNEYLLAGYPVGGWFADGVNTWSYSSADSPSFVISINADMSTVLCPGMRIKLTQTSVKYFIVTAVGAYGGGATLVTVYGGTDYTLANAAITSPHYSNVKAPIGFPLLNSKWSVETTDVSDTDQALPVLDTWYNIASLSLVVPIGLWKIWYSVALRIGDSNSLALRTRATLSTANNSQSDADMTTYLGIATQTTAGDTSVIVASMSKEKYYELASKTTYYLNELCNASNVDAIGIRGSLGKTIIRAVCAYL